jgi:hypothetical protein
VTTLFHRAIDSVPPDVELSLDSMGPSTPDRRALVERVDVER